MSGVEGFSRQCVAGFWLVIRRSGSALAAFFGAAALVQPSRLTRLPGARHLEV